MFPLVMLPKYKKKLIVLKAKKCQQKGLSKGGLHPQDSLEILMKMKHLEYVKKFLKKIYNWD